MAVSQHHPNPAGERRDHTERRCARCGVNCQVITVSSHNEYVIMDCAGAARDGVPLERMLTTSMRRLIPPFNRSMQLMECSLARSAEG